MAVRGNGSRTTSAPTAEKSIAYDLAVREGKEIVAKREADDWRLGELADRVQPKYADRTLEKFAKAIGVAACTLERKRSVFRAWMDISEPAPKSFHSASQWPCRITLIAPNS